MIDIVISSLEVKITVWERLIKEWQNKGIKNQKSDIFNINK